MWKLQWVYGLLDGTEEPIQIEASVQDEIQQAVPKAAEPRDCRSAVHRCLTYLGDLCRYQSQVRVWSRGSEGWLGGWV